MQERREQPQPEVVPPGVRPRERHTLLSLLGLFATPNVFLFVVAGTLWYPIYVKKDPDNAVVNAFIGPICLLAVSIIGFGAIVCCRRCRNVEVVAEPEELRATELVAVPIPVEPAQAIQNTPQSPVRAVESAQAFQIGSVVWRQEVVAEDEAVRPPELVAVVGDAAPQSPVRARTPSAFFSPLSNPLSPPAVVPGRTSY